MNVAILTLPLKTNFGGTLQAFALQKVVEDMGHQVVTINYREKENSDIRKVLSTAKQMLIYRNKKYFFSNKQVSYIGNFHKKFIRNNMNYSYEINNVKELKKYVKRNSFDAVIVGSDQVWRLEYSSRIDSFFLDFLSKNKSIIKASYAASFGLDEWQYDSKQTKKIKKYITSFKAVSVREESAVSLCDDYLGIKAEFVLDPTFLLNKERYLSLINSENIDNEKKIFSYILDRNSEKELILQKISKVLDKEVFSTQPLKTKKESIFIKNINSYLYPKIEDWLHSFKIADFVVTDSFHGTVFSIIFNKPFISIVNVERGASRFQSLLSLLNLEHRMVYTVNDLNDSLIKEKIVYSEINKKIKQQKAYSNEFLIKSLQSVGK